MLLLWFYSFAHNFSYSFSYSCQNSFSFSYSSIKTTLWFHTRLHTVNFIDDSWKLRARCLNMQFLPQDHTGEIIAEAMEATLDAWNLSSNRQICLTTDTGTNIINATGRLKWLRHSLVIICILPLPTPLKMTLNVAYLLVCATKLFLFSHNKVVSFSCFFSHTTKLFLFSHLETKKRVKESTDKFRTTQDSLVAVSTLLIQ